MRCAYIEYNTSFQSKVRCQRWYVFSAKSLIAQAKSEFLRDSFEMVDGGKEKEKKTGDGYSQLFVCQHKCGNKQIAQRLVQGLEQPSQPDCPASCYARRLFASAVRLNSGDH